MYHLLLKSMFYVTFRINKSLFYQHIFDVCRAHKSVSNFDLSVDVKYHIFC